LNLPKNTYVSDSGRTFLFKDIVGSGLDKKYMIYYNTSDGAWARVITSDVFYIDTKLVTVSPRSDSLSLDLMITLSEKILESVPSDSTALTVGGGLNRTFGDYLISLDSLLAGRVKLRLGHGNESVIAELVMGDTVFYKDLEVGLINPRLPAGFALIYVRDDRSIFKSNLGVRYCLRGRDYVSFEGGESVVLTGASNSSLNGFMARVDSYSGSFANLIIFDDSGGRINARLDCGGDVEVLDRKLKLLWIGQKNRGTVKTVIT
jgi:hypothetical protein